MGVRMPAKRLYAATHTIFRRRRCQLVDHNHNRTPLPVELHKQRLDRQTIRASSGNLSGVSSNAALYVSEAKQISAGDDKVK